MYTPCSPKGQINDELAGHTSLGHVFRRPDIHLRPIFTVPRQQYTKIYPYNTCIQLNLIYTGTVDEMETYFSSLNYGTIVSKQKASS
jgi:hypothetical protein